MWAATVNEIVNEFLVETHENLAQLDLDLVALERDPGDRETLARIFRTLHTIKGTSGFLGLPRLQAVAHAGENLLGRLRASELAVTPEITTALLGTVDAVREVLRAIEATGQEGEGNHADLIRALERLTRGSKVASPPPVEAVVVGPIRVAVPPLPEPPPVSIAPREPAETRAAAVSDGTVRVDVGLLDRLMTLVGELVLTRNQMVQYGATHEDSGFLGTLQRLNQLTTDLQTGVMKTRMQPIGGLWGKLPRLVRDLSAACQKQVRLELEGQETELDKTILEAIRDPLTHVVRNAVDHGIEPPAERAARGKPAEGRLHLHAAHEGGKVVVRITDDGGGIDPARVRNKAIANGLVTAVQSAGMTDRELVDLVFLPGFTTTDRVTHFSGRGVGMDVVRTNVEKIGGSVDIESRVGRGTTLTLRIPLTLAIIPALTVTSGGDRYCIPQVSLLELVRLDGGARGVEWVPGAPVYRLRGNLLPLAHLDRLLGVDPAAKPDDAPVNIVVLQVDDRPFGLVVDEVLDTQEIVVKPLRRQLKELAALAGATILGDGRVALILDVIGLAQRAGIVSRAREPAGERSSAVATSDCDPVLLVAGDDGGRMAIPLAAVSRLEEFPRAAVERAGGRPVVQYRGEILPLVDVGRALHSRRRRRRGARRETLQVVVATGTGRRVGLVVGRILDIVVEPVAAREPARRPGVLFTAVVQDRVTEFLDVAAVARTADGGAAP